MLDKLLEQVRYVPGTFDDDAVFDRLERSSPVRRGRRGSFNRVFYLSTAPTFFPLIVEKLGQHGLDRPRARTSAW